MSSRAYIVDLIHSIGEKTALTDHLEEKIIAGKDVENNEKELVEILSLRREQMSFLMEQGEKPDPEEWCAFKHSIKAFTQDVEVYEANPCNQTRDFMVRSANTLAMEISKLLGMEFETCARCLYDRLLVKQVEKEN